MWDIKSWIDSGTLISTPSGNVCLGWGTRVWHTDTDRTPRLAFYFPDFFLSSVKPWFTHPQTQELSLDQLTCAIRRLPLHTFRFQWIPPCRETFSQNFFHLQELIHEHILKKGVPYVFEVSKDPITHQTIPSLLLHLLDYA